MRKPILAAAAITAAGLLASCEPSNDLTVTNDNNVVLNDDQVNYAVTNDGELPANTMDPAMSEPLNETSNLSAMGNSTPE